MNHKRWRLAYICPSGKADALVDRFRQQYLWVLNEPPTMRKIWPCNLGDRIELCYTTNLGWYQVDDCVGIPVEDLELLDVYARDVWGVDPADWQSRRFISKPANQVVKRSPHVVTFCLEDD